METPASSGNAEPQFPRRFLLPIALYESNGLIFELYQGGKSIRNCEVVSTRPHALRVYQGGQRATKHVIRWIHLRPIGEVDPDLHNNSSSENLPVR